MLRLQDLSRKWQGFPLYFLFLDWVKCYDRIHHAPLLDALRRFGFPDHYLKILAAVYSDLKFFVADAWGSSEILRQAEGLRQACFLLLILMTVIMLDAREAYFRQCAEQNVE